MAHHILKKPLVGGAALGMATPALAQYTGPTKGEFATVEAVLSEAKDDAFVTLQGRLLEKVSEDKYMFADESGEIRVEIDREDFKTPIDDTTLVEIRGEVEKDFMETPEIDVETVFAVAP